MQAWHETDEFWEIFAPLMFTQERWEVVPGEVDQILGLLNLPAGAAVLDMACGPGRHSLELARRGYQVTGIDRTKAFIIEARRRAEAEDLPVTFIEGDMRSYKSVESFDAALNMYTAFGYFSDQTENAAALSNLARALKPGGRLLIDLAGKEIIARIFQARDWTEIDDVLLLQERTIKQNWSYLEDRWIKLEEGRRTEFHLGHYLYSAAELTSMLLENGFQHVQIFGSLAGAPYDQSAQRLVALAEK